MGKNKQPHAKGSKKVKADTFLKKEWRRVFIPGYFDKRDIGFTVSHKCARGKTPADYVNNRNFEISHGDVANEQSHAYRLFKWRSVAVENEEVRTYFAGMRVTRDKLCSILRKYRTLIEAQVDVRTPDGFILRVFSICFTKRLNSDKKHCYAQQSKRRALRDIMIKAMKDKAESCSIAQLCKALVEETIENQIITESKNVMQVDPVLVTKVKVLKAPTLSVDQMKKLYSNRGAAPAEVQRPEEENTA